MPEYLISCNKKDKENEVGYEDMKIMFDLRCSSVYRYLLFADYTCL